MSRKDMKIVKCNWDESSIDGEPLSPTGRIFHDPKFDFHVVAVLGWKTFIEVEVFKAGLQETIVHHPRFSSKMVGEEGDMRWMPTIVNIDDHVIVPNLDSEIASPDKFIEDYVHSITKQRLDRSIPLWEVHLLNVKTSEAESVAVFKIHHSVGDGASLVSLLIACCRKSSDPRALPTIPMRKQAHSWGLCLAIWSSLRMIINSFVHIMLLLATSMFLKDTETPIKGGPGIEMTPKRFVHRTVSLDDIKLIKDAMNVTVNDVVLGITEMALSKYLNRRYEHYHENNEKKNNLPRSFRIRAITYFNIRPAVGIQALADMMSRKSKGKWGNKIGYVLLPLRIALHADPTEYVRKTKDLMDRKKLSLEANFSISGARFLCKIFGPKTTAGFTHKVNSNTTLSYSNVPGPHEEVTFYGHPLAYIAPSIYGHPQALTVHFQSYVNKMTMVLAVDPDVIPDPHQLCEDFAESLEIIKAAI